MAKSNEIKKFIPKKGQIDFTNIRWAPVLNCVLKYKDTILLVQRNKDLKLYPGYWNGISGFLDDNKSLEEKVYEELKEEIGLSKKNIVAIKYGQIFDQDEPKYKKTWIVHPVLVDVNTDNIKLDWEAQNYKWININDVTKMNLLPGFDKVIYSFFKKSMKIIIGTTNPAKIAQIRDALKPLENIEVEGIDKKLLPEVIEDGITAQENAKKKALAYSKAIGQRVFSIDNALYFDGLAPENQPGVHVRRIGGLNAVNDTGLLEHGVSLIKSMGGKAIGHWEYGICMADPDGKVFEMTLKTPRIFTSVKSEKVIQGYPLESIQIDPETNKYISEMSPEEQSIFWQKNIGEKLCKFVMSSLEIS